MGRTGPLLLPLMALLGLGAGIAGAATLTTGTTFGIMIMAGLCALPLAAIFGVEWGLPAVMLAILAVEEFPSGLTDVGQESVERSTRTPFYAKSLGIGGVYVPDVLLGGIVLILLVYVILEQRRPLLRLDRISLVVVVLMAMPALSTLISFGSGNPFSVPLPNDETTALYNFNDRALSLIGLFQMKNYALLPQAYLAGLLYLDSRRRLDRLLQSVLLGLAVLAAAGVLRIALHPSIVTRGAPLFYDSPSSWLFALLGFYTVSAWAFRLHSRTAIAWMTALSLVAMLFILLSFRRTIWGGIGISGGVVLLLLPNYAKLRLLVGGIAIGGLMAIAVMMSPAGEMLLEHVAERVGQTTAADTSTLYRLALFVNFFDTGEPVPMFGYGIEPLWAKTFTFGYLRFNLENVHSLYFWLWLRTGLAGLVVALGAFLYLLYRSLLLFVRSRDAQIKVLSLCLFCMILIFLFSGLFNPIYGEVRYMLVLGVGLAVLTRIGQFSVVSSPYPVARYLT